MHHITQIKTALGISGVKTDCFPWCNLGETDSTQIDLVIERADRITNICEMKYTDHPFSISKDYDISLLKKRDIFQKKTGTKQALKLVLISAMGLSGVAHTEHISNVITLDDLFEH